MSTPQLTTLGSLWLKAYHESLGRFASSGARDVGAFCEAAYQLRCLWERSPDQGPLVRQLALYQMVLARQSAPRAALVLLAETALRASAVKSLEKQWEAGVMRELLLVPRHLQERRLFDALDQLDRCHAYRLHIASTPFGRWAGAKEALLRGDLCVESFELEAAAGYYSEAWESATSFLADGPALEEFCATFADLLAPIVDGSASEAEHFRQLKLDASWDVKFIVLRSAQAAAAIAGADSAPVAFKAVTDSFRKIGCLKVVTAIDLTLALAALNEEERSSFCDLLRGMSNSAFTDSFFAARGVELPKQLREGQGDKRFAEAEIAQIEVVERLAQIESFLIARNLPQGRKAWHDHIQSIAATKLAFPMLFAFGQQLRLAPGSSTEDEARAFQQFLQVLGPIVFEHSPLLLEPKYRSKLDPAIEAAVTYAVDRITDSPDKTLVPSALLDLQRSPTVTGFPRLLGWPQEARTTCEKGMEILADTLQRVRKGLMRWKDTVALVTQKRGTGLIFVCCESGGGPPRVIPVGERFVAAMSDLSKAAIDFENSRSTSAFARVDEIGRAAFNALPEDLRNTIRRHDTILLVPDYGAGHDALPYELMHDGANYLLAQVVIARFTSLQRLAATLETTTSTPSKRRALVIGVDKAREWKPLPKADIERQDVCAALSGAGFDAPGIQAERVTSRFIIDRLPFVDVLHFSGHGQTAVGSERLIMPDGSWMDSMDLERRRQRSLPFVYLNTCELGETRFLGGGRSRGLAFTFAYMGAPAVLAHTKAVFDDASAALATAFYREALKHPVGVALRNARRELLNVYPASEIARLVLLGNPKHALPGAADPYRVEDPTAGLLDRYFDLESDQWQRTEVLSYMVKHGIGAGGRLEAAASLVMSREDAMGAGKGKDRIELTDAIALSEVLGHLPSTTLFRSKLAHLAVEKNARIAADLLRAALPDVATLAEVDPRWEEHRKGMIATIHQIELEQRGIDRSRFEKASRAEADMLQGFFSAIAGTEGFWGFETPRLREIEDTLEDSVWNAVVMGYGNRFESVWEKVVVTEALVNKLVDGSHLAESTRPFALPTLTTVLSCVWAAKQPKDFSRDFVIAQTHMIEALIGTLRSSWAPPDPRLHGILSAVPDALVAALQRLDAASYEDGYKLLDSEMNPVRDLAIRTIESAAGQFPDSRLCSTAFVAGCFMTHNKVDQLFQVDGSYVSERLSATFEELSAEIKAHVSNASAALELGSDDELMRWRRADNQGRPR